MTKEGSNRDYDVVVIGGGQAGLALGYYLRRSGLRYAILDAQDGPGGAWRHGWQSLSLFSPARWSSLPGWIMPGTTADYPGKAALLAYISDYEKRYDLPVYRPVRVEAVRRADDAEQRGGSYGNDGNSDGKGSYGSSVSYGGGGNDGKSASNVSEGNDGNDGSNVSDGKSASNVSNGGDGNNEHKGGRLIVESDSGVWRADAVVSATGSWERPYTPPYIGHELFRGVQLHSAYYRSPEEFSGQRVLVVGGGNSGAQIYAEVSKVANATWVTLREPLFMPDYVDGRYLFDAASRYYTAQQAHTGEAARGETTSLSLGDIVMVQPVREARERGVLRSVRPFSRFTACGVVWNDGREEPVDAVIWCTGFNPALDHLAPLGVIEPDGHVLVDGTRALKEPRLWLLGYGDWTGFASATLVGVGRTARSTMEQIVAALYPENGIG